jgi:hypothetical protein
MLLALCCGYCDPTNAICCGLCMLRNLLWNPPVSNAYGVECKTVSNAFPIGNTIVLYVLFCIVMLLMLFAVASVVESVVEYGIWSLQWLF